MDVNWIATYDDGTKVSRNEGGHYGNLDRARVRQFEIDPGGRRGVRVTIIPGHSFFYRARTSITTGQEPKHAYLAGTVGPDGSYLAGFEVIGTKKRGNQYTNEFVPGHPVFSPIKPFSFESDLESFL